MGRTKAAPRRLSTDEREVLQFEKTSNDKDAMDTASIEQRQRVISSAPKRARTTTDAAVLEDSDASIISVQSDDSDYGYNQRAKSRLRRNVSKKKVTGKKVASYTTNKIPVSPFLPVFEANILADRECISMESSVCIGNSDVGFSFVFSDTTYGSATNMSLDQLNALHTLQLRQLV